MPSPPPLTHLRLRGSRCLWGCAVLGCADVMCQKWPSPACTQHPPASIWSFMGTTDLFSPLWCSSPTRNGERVEVGNFKSGNTVLPIRRSFFFLLNVNHPPCMSTGPSPPSPPQHQTVRVLFLRHGTYSYF